MDEKKIKYLRVCRIYLAYYQMINVVNYKFNMLSRALHRLQEQNIKVQWINVDIRTNESDKYFDKSTYMSNTFIMAYMTERLFFLWTTISTKSNAETRTRESGKRRKDLPKLDTLAKKNGTVRLPWPIKENLPKKRRTTKFHASRRFSSYNVQTCDSCPPALARWSVCWLADWLKKKKEKCRQLHHWGERL